jgi:hypothetical protein
MSDRVENDVQARARRQVSIAGLYRLGGLNQSPQAQERQQPGLEETSWQVHRLDSDWYSLQRWTHPRVRYTVNPPRDLAGGYRRRLHSRPAVLSCDRYPADTLFQVEARNLCSQQCQGCVHRFYPEQIFYDTSRPEIPVGLPVFYLDRRGVLFITESEIDGQVLRN